MKKINVLRTYTPTCRASLLRKYCCARRMSTWICAIFLGAYQSFATPAEGAPAIGSKTVKDGHVVDEKVDFVDWPVYGGNSEGDRYSVLAQIDHSNVNDLKIAWRYDTGEGGLQTSPLMIDGTLYAATPTQKIIALNATTGQLKWQFDPARSGQAVGRNVSGQPLRGLTYWKARHERRLFAGAGTHLYALDPETGTVINPFGNNGRVDLREGLDRDPQTLAVFLTSPGIVYKDVIIVGFRTSETAPAAPGAVRAYDVRTGQQRWIFNLIPRPGEPGHETWPTDAWKTAGGANSWSGFALDEKRGIVYVPTGSAVDDFYGADRHGDNLYANSLVALNAANGKHLWHFQAIHHDLWDWDFPSPPVLLTVNRDGRIVDAVAQTSKQGFVFVFDRVTGKSLFPIAERAVPQSTVPGEQTSQTQPFPVKPAPFARQQLTEDLLTIRTPEAHAWALKAFKAFQTKGPFTPLSLGRQTVVMPSFDGGAEWGGAAVDRERGTLYVNAIDIVSLGGLMEPRAAASQGEAIYQERCAVCHRPDRKGSPPQFPDLTDVRHRLGAEEIQQTISAGRGRMPGFPQLGAAEVNELVKFLRQYGPTDNSGRREVRSQARSGTEASKYIFTGYNHFLDPDGYPAIQPPWGTLSAIDLNTGEYIWRIPLGEYPELAAKGMRNTGTPNYGGPIVTASGLLFIGATIYDRKFRAFDAHTGEKLWEAVLPFAGVATPITYMLDGRQYVVIACSGSRDPKGPQGSAYIAFALPRTH